MLNKVLLTRLSVKIALISYWNDFSLFPFGKCASERRATKRCKNFKFWEYPLFKISEYAFKIAGCYCRLLDLFMAFLLNPQRDKDTDISCTRNCWDNVLFHLQIFYFTECFDNYTYMCYEYGFSSSIYWMFWQCVLFHIYGFSHLLYWMFW